MITGQTAGFDVMIGSTAQTAVHRVRVQTPSGVQEFSAAVTACGVSGQTTTDAPAQTRLQFGLPNLTASFTLAGLLSFADIFAGNPNQLTAASVFGKYSPSSPYYRDGVEGYACFVDYALVADGAGEVPAEDDWVPKFTGLVDTCVQNDDGSFDFTCVDNHGMFRAVVTTPAVNTAPPYNAGMTSEFVYDYLLRSGSGGKVGSWPANRPQCVWSVGLRSSLYAEVGTLDLTYSQPVPVFANDGTGSGLLLANTVAQSGGIQHITPLQGPAWLLPAAIGDTVFLRFYVRGVDTSMVGAPAVAVGSYNTSIPTSINVTGLEVAVGTTGINVAFTGANVTWTVAVDTGVHLIEVAAVRSGGNWSGTIRLDAATHTFSGLAGATLGNIGAVFPTGLPVVYGVNASTESSPATDFGWTPGAVLDQSLNPLTVIPQVSGDMSDIAQQLAEAELGVAGWDEMGIFRFYNRKTLASRPSTGTIHSRVNLESIGVQGTAASVVNRAQIPYTPWTFGTTASQLYSQSSVVKVPRGGGSTTFTATLADAGAGLDTTIVKAPQSGIDPTQSQYRASTTAAGLTEHPGVTFAVTQATSTTVAVVATNLSNVDAYLVSPASYSDLPVGTPMFTLAGLTVTAGDSTIADYQYPWTSKVGANGLTGAAGTKWGEVPYQPSDNGWVQDAGVAMDLAVDIVNDGATAKPDLTNMAIVPDPRIQLTDRVSVTDLDAGTQVSAYALVYGYSISYTADPFAYDMTIDARTVQAPGRAICGDPVTNICGSAYDYA